MFDPNLHPFLFTFALIAMIILFTVVAGMLGDRSYAAKGAGWKVCADDAERRRKVADAESEVLCAKLHLDRAGLA